MIYGKSSCELHGPAKPSCFSSMVSSSISVILASSSKRCSRASTIRFDRRAPGRIDEVQLKIVKLVGTLKMIASNREMAIVQTIKLFRVSIIRLLFSA